MTTRRHQTFVEIVDTFEQQSVEQRRRPLRAVRPDPVCVVDADGRRYRVTETELDDAAARDVIRGVAVVVVDDCGCGGGCPVRWPTSEQLAALAAAGPIRRHKKDSARFTLYRALSHARQLLLVIRTRSTTGGTCAGIATRSCPSGYPTLVRDGVVPSGLRRGGRSGRIRWRPVPGTFYGDWITLRRR